MTHPITVEQRVRERQQELVRLAQASHMARRAGAAEGKVWPWRRAVGRTLLAIGVRVGVPSECRHRAVRDAVAALDGPCSAQPVRTARA